MHSDFLGKLRQLMTLLLGDRRLQGLGYPGVPEDRVMVEMVVIDTVMNIALLVQVSIMVRYCRFLQRSKSNEETKKPKMSQD